MTKPTNLEPYRVYLADVSYFSGKLEAYMRYKEIPFQREEMTTASGVSKIYANTGLRKVPAVESADGLWFRETTNIIDWFEKQYPHQPILPPDPADAFISTLVEDYADEWCWRSAMYWRWKSNENARFLASRIGKEVFSDSPLPSSLAGTLFKYRQRMIFMRRDGVNPKTEHAVRDQYLQLSNSLSTILDQQPFLLGNRPTLVDIAFMGPFFRHYFCDPVPAQVMRDHYPHVLAWVSRVWNSRCSNMPSATYSDFSNPGWNFIIKEIMRDYLPYLHQNNQAWLENKTTFDNHTSHTCFKNVPVVKHRIYCLEELERQYQSLDTAAQKDVSQRLNIDGVIPIAEQLGGHTCSGIRDTYELPLPPRPKAGFWEKFEAYFLGSPWDLNRPPKS